ncbi:nitrogen permease regulator of amino acid transport activity 3-domain-containing protein [Massariosphaeria phaeospora]|uniref:Nitrogen permease regulator 3 n=1 Tax=Massariosphaeria phaeospora TaxID=100035 RepID=A0A7C8I7Z8_9PLEO|nr:nitrogen permease regulator of amino acid transport activity 3-domain-containing protein [Massariosphaeria phaeospora]
MALPLPPASNLHAILLVTKSRSLGPRLVFHYPALSPSAALATDKLPTWFGNATSTGSLASHSSSSDWDSGTDNEDDGEVGSRTSGERGSGRTAASHRERDRYRPGAWGRHEGIDEDDADAADNRARGGYRKTNGGIKEKGGDYDWNTVLGFEVVALEKLLCPSKAFNKRRFELGVESVVFVGAPMFVRDDGLWKKIKRKKKKRTSEERLQEAGLLASLNIKDLDGDATPAEGRRGRASVASFDHPQGFEPGYGHGMVSGAPSGAPSETGSDTRSNSTTNDAPDMTMFNVVFVLNPPALEYQLRVKDMYDNVTRKYAKALKYEQARFQHVWKESKKIIDIKQRAKENNESLTSTWRKIINTSPLAKSIAILFDAISNDKIAHIHFDTTFNSSFQIPQADSTPYLPSAMEPQMPGLWLTTSNVVIEDDVNDAPMTQHAALLLLEDPETLIKDLEGDAKGNTTALAFYIRNIIPTKSLQKICIKQNIQAQDMEYIARHLVYWRRARLIAPLHPRDTYIVSPNADMSALQAAVPSFASRFPTFPSLPKFLSMLSGTPRSYRSCIPTNEHREAYMEILAWLMRGGWVTQLRTFAWVRVTPGIKAAVAADMEQEAQQKRTEDVRRDASDNDSLTESIFSDHKRSSLLSGGTARPSTPLRRTRRDVDEEDAEKNMTLSPRVRPGWRGSPVRQASDAGSTSSNRTTIHAAPHRQSSPAQSSTKPHRPSPLHLLPKTQPKPKPTSPSPSRPAPPFSPSLHPSSPTTLLHASAPSQPPHHTSSLVLSPQKATALESRWLEKIGQGFADADVREQWPMLLRYLDGRHALEDVGIKEGLKRKRVAGLDSARNEQAWNSGTASYDPKSWNLAYTSAASASYAKQLKHLPGRT